MGDIVLRVENLSKQYRLGKIGTGSLRQDISYWWKRSVLKRPDAFFNGTEGDERFIWALNDINFELSNGDALGIIGSNGSGKSTLLKIISRITSPTKGFVRGKGTVSSILEIGTGFHQELSGRENIFMSGYALGMTKAEIKKKFDEIVAFSGIEKFIDTPVKRYSSGMYMRLAFAVAAHLEPDILVVDEVLAVGDAAFQKKCLGKMGTVARHGRTVLFVSHNMGAVVSLCSRALLLDAGRLVLDSDPLTVAARYQATLTAPAQMTDLATAEHFGSGKARFVSLRCVPERRDGTTREMMCPGSRLRIEMRIEAYAAVESANVGITIYDATGYRLVDSNTAMQGRFVSMAPGEHIDVVFTLENVRLKPGTYLVGVWIGRGNIEDIDGVLYAATLEVEPDPQQLQHSEQFPGPYLCSFQHAVRVASTSVSSAAAPMDDDAVARPVAG